MSSLPDTQAACGTGSHLGTNDDDKGLSVRLRRRRLSDVIAGLGMSIYAAPVVIFAMTPLLVADIAGGWPHGLVANVVFLGLIAQALEPSVAIPGAIGLVAPAMIYAGAIRGNRGANRHADPRRRAVALSLIVAPASVFFGAFVIAEDYRNIEWPSVAGSIVTLIPLSIFNIWAADAIARRLRRPPPRSISAGSD